MPYVRLPDSCIAESREPHWISQKSNLTEKFMFHMIHALHLAGRCVECGECERVCPMGIPVNMLKKKINRDMKELFDYEPGVKPEDKPPMFTFNVEEKTIKEHKTLMADTGFIPKEKWGTFIEGMSAKAQVYVPCLEGDTVIFRPFSKEGVLCFDRPANTPPKAVIFPQSDTLFTLPL